MVPVSKYDNFATFCGNSCELSHIVKGKVDMIFADPPYFLSKGKLFASTGNIRNVIRENGIMSVLWTKSMIST